MKVDEPLDSVQHCTYDSVVLDKESYLKLDIGLYLHACLQKSFSHLCHMNNFYALAQTAIKLFGPYSVS